MYSGEGSLQEEIGVQSQEQHLAGRREKCLEKGCWRGLGGGGWLSLTATVAAAQVPLAPRSPKELSP